MNNPFFSIIIPVYNLENYIEECIDSIVNQEFNDLEVIIINDGSSDRSHQICLNYNEKHSHISYIYQENSGVAITRNNGLKNARGQYIIFIDGDDYIINKNALSNLYRAIIDSNYPDIILHEETRLFSKSNLYYENNIELIKNNQGAHISDNLDELIYNEIIVASPWDKIVKRTILINHNISFPKNIKSEDMLWVADLLPHVQSYLLFPNSIYMYRQNRIGSFTTSVNDKHLYDIFEMLEIGLVKNQKYDLIFQKNLEHYWAEHYVFLLMNFNIIPKESRQIFLRNLKKYQYLLVKGATKNVDKVYKFYNYFGLKNTIKLLNFFRLINNLNKKYRLV